MPNAFDPYYTWLSIPPEEQPPNHYRLLGLKLLESNPEVIESAADRQMAHVRSFQGGKHAAASQKLLNELSAARLCLLDIDQKRNYDTTQKAKVEVLPRIEIPKNPATSVASSPSAAPIVRRTPARPLPVSQTAKEKRPRVAALADGTSSRRNRIKTTGRLPATFAGAALVLSVVVVLIWAVFGGRDSQTTALRSGGQALNVAGSVADNPDATIVPSKIGKWTFAGSIDWCGEIGEHPEIPDEPLVKTELSADQSRGRIVGKSTRTEDTIELFGRPCGWFGKALVWDTTVAELDRTIRLVFGAPWIDGRIEYGLALYSPDEPTKWLFKQGLRNAVVQIETAPMSGGKSRVGVFYDGQAVEGSFVADNSKTVRLALSAEMRYGGFDCDLSVQIFASQGPTASSESVSSRAGHPGERFLSTISPTAADVASTLVFKRVAIDGVLSEHGIYTHPPGSNRSAHVVYELPPGYNAFHGRAGITEALELAAAGSTTPLTFRILGDGNVLWTSSPKQNRGVAENFAVSIRQVRTLELFVDCPGDSSNAWAAWIDPCLNSTTPPLAQDPRIKADSSKAFLSGLMAEEVRGFGGSSLYAKPVWLRGSFSPHGLCMHPNSGGDAHVAFQLAGGFSEFVGQVGIDDNVPSTMARSELVFRVTGDGRQLWKSQPHKARHSAESFAIDVTGVRKLELFVDCPGKERFCDAVWFEPQLRANTSGK